MNKKTRGTKILLTILIFMFFIASIITTFTINKIKDKWIEDTEIKCNESIEGAVYETNNDTFKVCYCNESCNWYRFEHPEMKIIDSGWFHMNGSKIKEEWEELSNVTRHGFNDSVFEEDNNTLYWGDDLNEKE